MSLVKQNLNEIDEQIVVDSLKVIARFSCSRRALLAFLNHDWRKMRGVFAWPENPNQSNGADDRKKQPDLWMQSGWWIQQLRQKQFLRFYSLSELPDEVEIDLVRLREEAVQALCLMAVFDGKRLAGVLRLDNPQADRNLGNVEVDLIQMASTLILQVVRASENLKEMRKDAFFPVNTPLRLDRVPAANRIKFTQDVQEAFQQKGQLFSILLIEVDGLSLIQHRYGLDVSSRMMHTTLERIRAGLRTSDLVSLLEDDLIGILLVDLFERSYTDTVARRILQVFNTPFRINGKDIGLTASIGASYPLSGDLQAESLLREAEIALNQARRTGKERYLAFNEEMRARLLGRMELENDLRGSLKHGHLILHYQPITTMEDGRLIGFEALVRWQHPTRGLIWPADFIQLSEDTGLILPLGEWVLREACRQMNVWQKAFRTNPSLVISVNISVMQLEQRDFPATVGRILAETGLPANTLRLEITESVLAKDGSQLAAGLSQLHEMGVQLYIDDFGTGYSSLSYLDSLPADAIKIDRSFVSNMTSGRYGSGVVQAIIQMARDLKIDVVAEGVETLEQKIELKRLNCGFYQGYLISEPLASQDVSLYIRRNGSALSGEPLSGY